MATASGTFSSYPSLLTYRVTADEVGVDTPNNRSLVRVRAYIDFSGFSASSDGGSGTTTAGNWSRGATSFSSASSLTVYSPADFYVNHSGNGTGSYSFSGTSSMLGWGSASTNTGTLTFTNINTSPTIPTITEDSGTARNTAATSYTATATGGVNNSGPTVTYTLQSSTTTNFASTTDHGTTTTSGGSVSATGLNANTTYYFRIKASNAGGTKYSTDTAPGYTTSYGIPNQPTSVVATPSTTANDRISVSWTAPTYIGAGLITGNLTSTGAYTITRSGTPARTFYSNTNSVVDTDLNLVPGNSYTYVVKATTSSSGGSPSYTGANSTASVSKIAPGTPYAPTAVPSISSNGLDITVVSAAVSADGGVAINTANANEGYFTQYQLADTLAGTYGYGGVAGDWSPAVKMSNQTTRTHTYSSMTPAKYYKFRAYGANTVTKASDTTTNIAYPHNNITYTSGVNFATNTTGYFLAAGGKRFDGTNWIPTQTAKRFDGTNWVPLTIAKRFNGTTWVPLS